MTLALGWPGVVNYNNNNHVLADNYNGNLSQWAEKLCDGPGFGVGQCQPTAKRNNVGNVITW